MTCYVDRRVYTLCAEKGQTCSFNGQKNVFYGVDGKFAYQKATDGVVCDSAKFNNLKVDGAMCYTK